MSYELSCGRVFLFRGVDGSILRCRRKHLFKFFRKHGLNKKETIEPGSRALEISLVARDGEFIFLRDNPGECGILLVMVGSGVENDDVVPFKRL